MVDRTKIPVSGKPKDVLFPKHKEFTLSNGMKLFIIENFRIPYVTFRFIIKSGSVNDSLIGDGRYGTSQLTADLLTKGSTNFSSSYISDFIDFHGALFSTGAEMDYSFFGVSCMDMHFEKLLELSSELIIDSNFPSDEFNKKKNQLINTLISYKDNGSYLAERVFKNKLFGSSPYAFDEEGTIATVSLVTRDDVLKYFSGNYNAENIAASVVGSVKSDKVIERFEKLFSKLKSGKTISPNIKQIMNPEKNQIYLTEKNGAVQSSIHLGHSGVNRNHPDLIPIIVMNTILGGFFTSRINQNIREKNGFSYGARSSFSFFKYQGDFSAETEVNTEKTADAVSEIIKEISLMKMKGITQNELDTAKKYISGSFPFQIETSNAVASKLLSLELYGIEKNFYNTYISRINSLTVSEVNVAAEKYLHPESLIISIAGNIDSLKQKMKQLGEITVIESINDII